MENSIVKLEQDLTSRPEWTNVISKLHHEYVRDDMKEAAISLNRIIHYFGEEFKPGVYEYHEGSAPGNEFDRAVSDLRSQISHTYRTFDDAGLSKVMTLPEFTNFLKNFNYATATQFREEEKKLIEKALSSPITPYAFESPTIIPEEAWNRFWRTVDENKWIVLNEINQNGQNERFFYGLFLRRVRRELSTNTFNFVPMSPFKWSKVICFSIGGLLGVVNAALALPTAGIAMASAAAGVISTAIGSGFER